MVMESTFRLSDYSWLCGLENQTLTPSIYRNGLAEVYSRHRAERTVCGFKKKENILSTGLKRFGIRPLSTLSLFVFSNYLDTRASSAVESTSAH